MKKYDKTVQIFDSTLRDGAQAEGISFSVEDKLAVIAALDELGVAYIEAGNPGSNPKDLEFFERAGKMELKNAKLVAFGSTRRKNISAEDDGNCKAILAAGTDTVAIFGKSWLLHATEILKTTPEENLAMIEDTVKFFKARGKAVFFDAEHFFDGYKDDPAYAFETLRAAARAGADCLVLCDTNGGCFPGEISDITKKVCGEFAPVPVGIHCHNDGGMAVANSAAAVFAGASQVQGTLLGFGERTGNANLSTLIANLQLKRGIECIPEKNLSKLTDICLRVAETANITLAGTMPFVGASAFAHKAGMHADGVLKNSRSFEHIEPESVGNHRRFLISEMSGKTALLEKIRGIAPELDKNSPETARLVEELKSREHEGYQYEGAEGSFELTVRKALGSYNPFFDLVSYKILCEQPADNGKSATATLKLTVNGKFSIAAAEGDGPVHALDLALREALREFYPRLSKAHLIDYKVRVMEPRDATAAKVRVLITSTDGKKIWTTIGVSCDIIEASWTALVDSIEYYLIKEKS